MYEDGQAYVSPNHQEFGLRIGSPRFNARSPLTHLITVQRTHQSRISAPISIWSKIAQGWRMRRLVSSQRLEAEIQNTFQQLGLRGILFSARTRSSRTTPRGNTFCIAASSNNGRH